MTKSRNNYFSKPRRSVNMWILYIRYRKQDYFFPQTDVHNQAIAYPSKKAGAADLYNTLCITGKGNAYLQRVGPIC